MPSRPCPKCNGSMSEGFVLDRTHGGTVVPSWVEGQPVRSLWTGLNLSGKPRIEISSWRCGRCGFLEQYAAGRDAREDGRKQVQKALMIVAIVTAVVAAVAGGLTAAVLH